MMRGGLVVLAPGSPVQVMFAILIMLLHLLFLLKLAPYVKDTEDWSSFFATLGLCLMSLGALMMMKVQDDEATPIGLATTALPIVCIVIVLGIMIMYDFGLKQRCCCGGSREASSKNVKKTSSTQVQPINTNNETMLDVHGRTAQQQEDHQILRNWGTNTPTQVATPASAHY